VEFLPEFVLQVVRIMYVQRGEIPPWIVAGYGLLLN